MDDPGARQRRFVAQDPHVLRRLPMRPTGLTVGAEEVFGPRVDGRGPGDERAETAVRARPDEFGRHDDVARAPEVITPPRVIPHTLPRPQTESQGRRPFGK